MSRGTAEGVDRFPYVFLGELAAVISVETVTIIYRESRG